MKVSHVLLVRFVSRDVRVRNFWADPGTDPVGSADPDPDPGRVQYWPFTT